MRQLVTRMRVTIKGAHTTAPSKRAISAKDWRWVGDIRQRRDMSVLVSTTRVPSLSVRPVAVRRAAERMLEALGRSDAELSILLCDDATIRELNRSYRGKDRPTDVLAFAMGEGEGAELAGLLLGDVVISLETARRQASDRGLAIAFEVTFLLAHGVLHLVGYDHRNDAEERVMNAQTEALVVAARGGSGTAGLVERRAKLGKKAPPAPPRRPKKRS